MNPLQALLMSVVEGLTEFLPVSSTGHLIITAKILNISSTTFTKTFEVVIQSGAIFAVILLYREKIFGNFNLWKKILPAFLPTGVVGLIFYKTIKTILLENDMITVLSLFSGGILLILLETFYLNRKRNRLEVTLENLDTKKIIIIGLFQSLAVIPGISRSAATIVGCLLVGLNRRSAVEFSFLLAVPTILAASIFDLTKNGSSLSSPEILLIITGFLGSFLTATAAIKYLLIFIKDHDLIPFGIYRIAAALAYGWFNR